MIWQILEFSVLLFSFSAVSKSLSFTEESLVITEVAEKDVVMESITTQIKEAMECTVKIVVHYSNFQSEKHLFEKHNFYE